MTGRSKNLFFLFCLLVISGGILNAQPVSATGQIHAEVISAFTATETAQMNFGKFFPGAQGGEIILSPQSTVSTVGSVFKGSGLHNAASFYLTGDLDAAFTVTLPSRPVILSHSTSAKTLEVKDWISIPSPTIGAGNLQNGFQIVYVGATLKVGTLNENPVGYYTGTYSISFDFN